MARAKKRAGWGMRLIAILALIFMAVGGWFWWEIQHWTPDEAAYPDQGAMLSTRDGDVNFRTLRALGGSFVYLSASSGESGQDDNFGRNLAKAREAGLQVGAVHHFDPCKLADAQSANFVTMVPRGKELLPPAIELSDVAGNCDKRVPDAAVESELMTLINQIENHSGTPVILKISPEFEDRYGLARRIERNLWLHRTRFVPTYAGRPWLLWTANDQLRNEASEEPMRWVVVQP